MSKQRRRLPFVLRRGPLPALKGTIRALFLLTAGFFLVGGIGAGGQFVAINRGWMQDPRLNAEQDDSTYLYESISALPMPQCAPAVGVSVDAASMTCASTSASESMRAAVLSNCRLSDSELTREWWRPSSTTVAFFYATDDNNDARYDSGNGRIDCG